MRRFTLSVFVLAVSAMFAFAQQQVGKAVVNEAMKSRFGQKAAQPFGIIQNSEKKTVDDDCAFVRKEVPDSKMTVRKANVIDDAGKVMITEAPAGEIHALQSRSSTSYFVEWGMVAMTEVDGMLGEFVVGDDGYIYIKNPFAFKDTQSYVKIRLNGTEAKMEGPQLIYRDKVYTDEIENLYIARLRYDEETNWYYYDEDNTEIVFNYVDGVLKQKPADIMYGLVQADGNWVGYADYGLEMKTIDDESITMPSGANVEKYTLGCTDGATLVDVAFSGNDVYVAGLNSARPDACVKGTVSDGKVIFDAGQYLGINQELGYHIWFMPAVKTEVYVEELGTYIDSYEVKDKIVFDYDETAGSMKSDEVVLVNGSKTLSSPLEIFNQPYLKPYAGKKPAKPEAPTVTEFLEIRDWYGDGDIYGAICFVVSGKDVDGNYIDGNDLYYNIIANEQVFTFTTDVYVDISEPMTDVPYYFETGYNFIINEPYRIVYFEDPSLETIGVQLKYTVDGVTKKSDIAYYNLPDVPWEDETGVTDVNSAADAEVVDVTYTDLQGRVVRYPSKGLYIKTTTYSDGKVTNVKISKK